MAFFSCGCISWCCKHQNVFWGTLCVTSEIVQLGGAPLSAGNSREKTLLCSSAWIAYVLRALCVTEFSEWLHYLGLKWEKIVWLLLVPILAWVKLCLVSPGLLVGVRMGSSAEPRAWLKHVELVTYIVVQTAAIFRRDEMLGAVYTSHTSFCLVEWKAENAEIAGGSCLESLTALCYLQS